MVLFRSRFHGVERASERERTPTLSIGANDVTPIRSAFSSHDSADNFLAMNALPQQQMTRLLTVVQELSLARDLPTVMAIIRLAARELVRADGATFVLRDDGKCYYVDEDAIPPLWKG